MQRVEVAQDRTLRIIMPAGTNRRVHPQVVPSPTHSVAAPRSFHDPLLTKEFLIAMKPWLYFVPLCLSLALPVRAQDQGNPKNDPNQDEKIRIKTETITVEAKLPKDLPYSSTSEIRSLEFELFKPRSMTDVLSFTSGTYVSTGNKGEWGVKIRGLGTSRITLLYDGIPVYEPYYNSFDLKSIPAEQVESVKVVKGASSVLYGANTLGGIVDVVTRRPESNQFSLRTDYGTRNTYGLYADGGVRGDKVLFTGSVFREGSDGFNIVKNGNAELRPNTDYRRDNVAGKFFYYPGGGSELMAEVNYYQAEYGIPTATSFYRANYWRFKDWQRLVTNLGGSFPILNRGYLKTRFYYVRHYNVLDAYTSSAMTTRQWESTFDNYALGAYALAMMPLGDKNDLNASLSFRDDNVSTQSDLNMPWENYNHKTFSFGVEDHFRIVDKLALMAGASLDHLSKQNGENKTTLNPLTGVKFNPRPYVDLHLTLSQKSRFPSMKDLYSQPVNGGNPDLRDEKGRNVEFGATYEKAFMFSAAVFHNRIRDMIESRIDSQGNRQNVNVAEATIKGFELEASKALGPITLTGNYTYLNTMNQTTGDRLDLIPSSQFNAVVHYFDPRYFSATFWTICASNAIAHGSRENVIIDSYTVSNVALERELYKFDIYFKVENLLNREYLTEPGYPMRARTFTVGLRFALEGRGK